MESAILLASLPRKINMQINFLISSARTIGKVSENQKEMSYNHSVAHSFNQTLHLTSKGLKNGALLIYRSILYISLLNSLIQLILVKTLWLKVKMGEALKVERTIKLITMNSTI